jgi:hypothetical protein
MLRHRPLVVIHWARYLAIYNGTLMEYAYFWDTRNGYSAPPTPHFLRRLAPIATVTSKRITYTNPDLQETLDFSEDGRTATEISKTTYNGPFTYKYVRIN